MTEQHEFDLQDLLDYLGGDPQFTAEMVDLFFNDADKAVAGMKASFAKGDFEELHEHAHALKGGAGNIRVLQFRDYVQTLATAATQHSPDCGPLMERLDHEYARVIEILRGWQKTVRV